jgi:thymidylate synthase (methanogen type)
MGYGVKIVQAETLGEGWEKAVFTMMTEGFDRWVEAPEFRTMTKDSPMFLMISNPMKQPRLSSMAPISIKLAEEYANNLVNGLSPEKENSFDYTYYSRLRCYPDCQIRAWAPNVTNEKEMLDFVQKTTGGKCVVKRIDQVQKAIETLKKDLGRRSVVMHTWIPMRDLEKFTPQRKDTSSPCLVLIHPQIVEDKIHFNVVMKTNDLFSAWSGNAFAFTALQKYMAEQLEVDVGAYNHYSVAMQIYQDQYELANKIVEKYKK